MYYVKATLLAIDCMSGLRSMSVQIVLRKHGWLQFCSHTVSYTFVGHQTSLMSIGLQWGISMRDNVGVIAEQVLNYDQLKRPVL